MKEPFFGFNKWRKQILISVNNW